MTMSEPPSPLSPPDSPAELDPSPAQSPPELSPLASQTQFPPLGRGIPTLRAASDTGMTHSSTPLGNVNAARKPVVASNLPSSMQAKMRAFHLSRQGAPPQQSDVNAIPISPSSPHGALTGGVPSGPVVGGMVPSPGGFRLPGSARPQPLNSSSAPVVPRMPPKGSGGLAAKRGLAAGLKLSDATGSPPGSAPGTGVSAGASKPTDNAFSRYSDYIDTTTGTLRFKGKATLHGSGVEFSGGSTFSISLDEVDTIDELGKGNYGTVYQVRHARPRIRRPGMGLAGNKAPNSVAAVRTEGHGQHDNLGNVMAMKEIRLELDDAKFAAIIMELDVLHRCVSPFIIDFYGAFFQEGAVYICMEYMDGGSIDKLYADGVPEGVLRKVALSTVMGLKSLKDEHNIIHRDVKPTNILVNQRGQVKLCDFGVSGNLVASIAKTNIGCQSYMAPERISNGGIAQAGANPGGGTYSVQSDIWSLGLTLIECALGRYPYPPETYNNIFSQLSVSSHPARAL
jgi:mitogen-activated protein kinase kinase